MEIEMSPREQNIDPDGGLTDRWIIFMVMMGSKTWDSTSLVSSSDQRQLLYEHEIQNQHSDHKAGSCGHRSCHSARILGTFSSKSPRG